MLQGQEQKNLKLDVIALSHFYIVSLSVSISKNLIERKQKRVHTDCKMSSCTEHNGQQKR